MLITGQGGGGGFFANDNSTVTIESTSDLVEGAGGIWNLNVSSESHLDMSGGEVHQLTMNNTAAARLTGGFIQQIWSYQHITAFSEPHVTIVYSGDLPTYNETNNILTGLWGNGDPFSIYLSDVPASNYGYSPAIDNIQFELIPEPASLVLLGIGSLLLRRRTT